MEDKILNDKEYHNEDSSGYTTIYELNRTMRIDNKIFKLKYYINMNRSASYSDKAIQLLTDNGWVHFLHAEELDTGEYCIESSVKSLKANGLAFYNAAIKYIIEVYAS